MHFFLIQRLAFKSVPAKVAVVSSKSSLPGTPTWQTPVPAAALCELHHVKLGTLGGEWIAILLTNLDRLPHPCTTHLYPSSR